jgi:galactokinase
MRLVAHDFGNAESEFALAHIPRDEVHRWSNYLRGVAFYLRERGLQFPGLDALILGDVPIASGLSSSAALEVCAATTLQLFGGFDLDKVALARLCQKAENEFVGVNCGIMDQFIAALARADHALLIDTRDLSYQYAPLPHGAAIIVADTMKRRELSNSAYNTRRAECEEAARQLGALLNKPVRALRDVSVEELVRVEKDLPPTLAQRARHVIHENARVEAALVAGRQNDLAAFGRLMNESHESLKHDYAVSCAELDAMVEIARTQIGCLGARLTGAGFGGCTLNLLREEHVPAFAANLAREYRRRVGLDPQIYVVRATDGAGVVG